MNCKTPLLSAVLAGLLVSGAALAAVNPDAVHLALDSLLVASSKTSVANAIVTNSNPPATNAQAHLGAPSTMTTTEIKGIVIGAGGVISVYLAPNTGTNQGVVKYVPKMITGKKGKRAVQFTCVSPNIPEIHAIAGDCTYQAGSTR